ncbi:MAG: FAD-binding oxidoreductase [Burkholderiales bacterium]
MRRWNGWGDDGINAALDAQTLAFLQQRIGAARPFQDATLAQTCRGIAPSRLPAHRLIDTTAQTRLRCALGQSLSDWLQLRYGRVGAVPDGVAFPESGEQVRELLAYARGCAAAVIAYGGGTSVAGHLSAPAGAQPVLTVNLSRLTRLIELDREAQLARFGAGVAGPDLEAQLRAQGYTLGHFPQSFEYSTLGGWIATRSCGQQSLRYGRIEQLFAGGTIETPGGTLLIPTFPASAAGIDLREMVLGSEGRLGILTEASVRVTPLPEREMFDALFFPDWDRAEAAVRALVQARLPLSLLRLSNAAETLTMLTLAGRNSLLALLQRYLAWRGCAEGKCLLLVGASGRRAEVAGALGQARRIARRAYAVHAGRVLGEKWKQNRFRSVYLRNALWQNGYAVDTAETAVDWPRVGSMMRAMEQAASAALASQGERLHAYTHLSHLYAQGASVYSTFVWRLAGDYDADLARWRALKAAVCEAVVAKRGSISHQHGVGADHAPYLAAEKGALGIGAMRALLRHFDPQGMMNPGKLLPPEN